MQYAILIDDLPMVKKLQEMGTLLTFSLNKTWDYVNSYAMKNYTESFIGQRKYSNMDDEGIDYYLSLIDQDDHEPPKQYAKK